jgi:hypothetical protein
MQSTDRALSAALMPGLPHGAFRLYVILAAASRDAGAENEYFPVTLEGLMLLHPGIAGRSAGATTVIKQVATLRKQGLLDTRAAIHRTEPKMPVLVKVLDPPMSRQPVANVANSQ